jgi:hypothetical protein
MSEYDDGSAERQAAAYRAMGYEWVEGGEGGSYQYTGRSLLPPVEPPALRVTPGMTEAQLQKLTTQTPITKTRFVETGEGGYDTYDYYDPASQAKQLLAQPAQVSTDYIRNNFPSLAQLPQSVLNQMGQDWRTAYAHIQKMPEQSASGWWGGAGGKEGFVPVPIKNRGTGQPELQVGGNGEMFAEALPYVTYSPEYGLGVPKAGMRPYDSGFSFLDFVGAAAPGIALSTILGPAGFGLSLPAAGAVSGGFNALMNDGNVLKGALTGGALGGLGQAASPLISSAVGATGLTGAAADAVKAGALAAGKAAITGGDPLQAALMAGAGSSAGSTVSTLDFIKDLDPGVAKALTAAASGAAKAAVGGVDPVTAALESAFKSGAGSAWSSLTGPAGGASTPNVPIAEWDSVTPFETPTESWIDRGMLGQPIDWDTQDLLNALGQQEEDQAGMRSELLGYDPRILEALSGADVEQEDLQRLLSQTGLSGGSANLGKMLSGIGSAGKTAGATQATQQPAGQGQMDIGSLLGLMGMMQGKAPEKETPIPLVGEIKPYQFSTDLLQGVYGPRMAQGGSVDELMDIIRR